jgi:hypothetical protein
MYRFSVRALAVTRRAPTGSSTSGRVLAVHNGLEGRVQLVTASELRALDPKCTPGLTPFAPLQGKPPKI